LELIFENFAETLPFIAPLAFLVGAVVKSAVGVTRLKQDVKIHKSQPPTTFATTKVLDNIIRS
jgi:hypothetical protein